MVFTPVKLAKVELRALRGYLSLRGYDVATTTPDEPADEWVPSKLQRKILNVLGGFAMTADKLELAVGVSRSTLYGKKRRKRQVSPNSCN